mmetsp:Transcript_46655/g.91134  ORF Transcript_46655/g.91134 Transcript_46655/m.91134 type:complete len:85 (-) Transcript_46655:144-398(-)
MRHPNRGNGHETGTIRQPWRKCSGLGRVRRKGEAPDGINLQGRNPREVMGRYPRGLSSEKGKENFQKEEEKSYFKKTREVKSFV